MYILQYKANLSDKDFSFYSINFKLSRTLLLLHYDDFRFIVGVIMNINCMHYIYFPKY